MKRKTCYSCGGDAYLRAIHITDSDGNGHLRHEIVCSKCGKIFSFDNVSKEALVRMWNEGDVTNIGDLPVRVIDFYVAEHIAMLYERLRNVSWDEEYIMLDEDGNPLSAAISLAGDVRIATVSKAGSFCADKTITIPALTPIDIHAVNGVYEVHLEKSETPILKFRIAKVTPVAYIPW